MTLAAGDPRHGTVKGYGSHGCRCANCRTAWAKCIRKRVTVRSSKPIPPEVPHGTTSTYVNYRCRCQPCSDARAVSNRDYRARRKVGFRLENEEET